MLLRLKRQTRSMRWNVLFFLGSIILLFVFSNIYSIYRGRKFEQRFDDVLTRYHTINDFLISYTRGVELFERYIDDQTEDNWMIYISNDIEVRGLLRDLVEQAEELPLDDYLLVQSVKNIYSTYDSIISKSYEGGQETEQLKKIYELSEIMNQNVQQLIRVSMTYGVQAHQDMKQEIYVGQCTSISLMIFVVMIAVVFLSFVIEHVLNPIQNLSEAVKRIEEEKFDIPDLSEKANDEIGHLNRGFNRMKKRMRHIIHELKEKQILSEKVHEQELQLMNHEKMLEKARYTLLQSQINPHFLFNTLNVISGMATMEHAKITNELIMCLSRLFRYNLENKEELVRLSKELAMIKNYVYIEKKRFGERLTYMLRADIDPDRYQIPPFTLQPFIENSILHGIMKRESGGTVAIKVCARKGWLLIRIIDNGVGMEQERRDAIMNPQASTAERGAVSGIGIYNVFSRLKLLYPSCELKIRTIQNRGTCIEIKILEEDCIYD